MKIIGLCGGTGSGKGTVAALFSSYGFASVDTDAVYHSLISAPTDCVKDISSAFGSGILNDNGGIDRKKLSELVFANDGGERLALLNKIAHFHILNETRKIISAYDKSGFSTVLIDAPLLFESGFDKECDYIIAVIAKKDCRLERIIKRDSISEEKALLRMSSQLSDEYISERADFVIENNGTLLSLKSKVAEISKKINNI